MKLEYKILNSLERISEVLKALLWEKAKIYSISPIQIQILLFISSHKTDICNVSYLAKEFNITKATISDAVRVLLNKQYLAKDFSPLDKRRYNLLLTGAGENLVNDLSTYAHPISKEFNSFNKDDLDIVYNTLLQLIFQLNQGDVIQVQRTCFNCNNYSGNKQDQHYCQLLKRPLKSAQLEIDCTDFANL